MTRAFAILAILLGCSHPDAKKDRPSVAGSERADCRPDGTCETGLLCLSNLCVRPPAADCKLVAEQLTSLEIGNYAEPEERAPHVTKHSARCEAERVSKEEGACLTKARDRWTASQCVPRLFPELSAPGTECAQIAEKTQAAVSRQYRGYTDPQTKKYVDAMVDAIRQACTEDHWSATVVNCVLAGDPEQTVFSDQRCFQQQTEQPLMQKLQERYQKLIQQAQR